MQAARTHQVDVGVQDGGVHRLAVPGPHCRRDGRGAEELPGGLRFSSFPPHFSATASAEHLCLPHFQRAGLCDRAQLPGSQGTAYVDD